MGAQHTPGPWAIETSCPTSIWSGGHYVAETFTDGAANARLIAAAPDLLAALRTFAEDGHDIAYVDAVMNARAAIAKAEGRV